MKQIAGKEQYEVGRVDDYNLEQVKWSCRRGMLELDKILLPFFEEVFTTLPKAKKDSFVALLSSTDQELYSWLLGNELPALPVWQDLIMVMRFVAKKRMQIEQCNQ